MAERDVLVVDDEPKARELLRYIFEAAGYNCLLASDGDEGLEVFRKARPPLVVTDVLHPGINGIELLRQVRALDGDMAVIVLTGAASVKTAIECLKGGAYAFLLKPPNLDELLITVERALERRQLLIEHREHQQAHGQRQEAQRDVLIVEYDPAMRRLFHEAFVSWRYTCVLASDGREGLEMFKARRPPLVLADLGRPMTVGKWVRGEWVSDAGIGLLMEIRQEDPDVAVIILGWMDVKTYNASLKLGAYAFLWKPVNLEELQIVAERALERRQLLIERRQRHERA